MHLHLQPREGITTGNIEFWGAGYAPASSLSVPNSSGSTFDFGDHMLPGPHGCMQVHNHGASQTLFAYNDWGSNAGGISEVGIGNNTAGTHPDWTSSDNAAGWARRRLFVLARRRSSSGSGPEILSNPCDRTASAGSDVTFSVTLHGDGPFTYQWRRDGVDLAGQNQAWLELPSVTEADVASYDVTVTDLNFAAVTSQAASLTLADDPPSPYEQWRSNNGLTASDGDLDDRDCDGLVNLMEFAFGTDPNLAGRHELAVDGSIHGTPIIRSGDGQALEAIFVRRDDHWQSGSLIYSVEFSSDLRNFYASTVAPVSVVDSSADAAYEIVKVPFPATTPSGKPARFFRVRVQLVP